MELWIRSQNKTILSKVHDLVIREDRNENNEINYFIVDTYTLGIYKTKERALKILDEIQELLKPTMIVKTHNITTEQLSDYSQEMIIQPAFDDIQKVETYVYEMPQE